METHSCLRVHTYIQGTHYVPGIGQVLCKFTLKLPVRVVLFLSPSFKVKSVSVSLQVHTGSQRQIQNPGKQVSGQNGTRNTTCFL